MDDTRTIDELACWLALSRGPAQSAATLTALARKPGAVCALFDAAADNGDPGADPALRAVRSAPDWNGVEADLRWLASGADTAVVFADAHYPALLRNIPDPPPVLFVRGRADVLGGAQLAVVGTRKPTPDGVAQARAIAGDLARAGVAVTSGLAVGIDAEAHTGALDAGGVTIAVLGCGVGCVYPARNAALADRIAGPGAVITEFGAGTPPRAANFPRRNRIISGLALGTLVVEAALRSGSLITAGLAAAQGREVFAIPGSIRNPMTAGCHHLIQQGAKLVTCVRDILVEIRELADRAPTEGGRRAAAAAHVAGLDERCRLLLDNIGFGPVTMDELIDQTGLAAGITASLLSSLEISGHIEVLPGGRVVRR
jgi:DNA processing protein